jgi:S-adenosylmethionine hydrolase
MPQPLVALLTDFGTSDPYVGVMKGVMLTRCPDLRFIDITHEVNPQNLRQAAYLLHSAYRYFPPHTIFLVVVDPGVGTERQSLAVQTDRGFYVGPDNGIFGTILEEVDTWQAVTLWPQEPVSATFHGRDLFAPAAADLACGRSLNEIGSPTADIVRLNLFRAERAAPDTLEGEIIHIDHFGNLVTSLGPFAWDSEARNLHSMKLDVSINATNATVQLGEHHITGIHATYGQTRPGDLLALINSDRQLEIAVNQGNAAQSTGAQLGDPVTLKLQG